jgi:hypothetical protein
MSAPVQAKPVEGPDLFGRFHWNGRIFDSEIAAEQARRDAPIPTPRAGRAPKIPPVPCDVLTMRDRTFGIRNSKGAIAAAITWTGAMYVLQVGRRTVGTFTTLVTAQNAGRREVALLEKGGAGDDPAPEPLRTDRDATRVSGRTYALGVAPDPLKSPMLPVGAVDPVELRQVLHAVLIARGQAVR